MHEKVKVFILFSATYYITHNFLHRGPYNSFEVIVQNEFVGITLFFLFLFLEYVESSKSIVVLKQYKYSTYVLINDALCSCTSKFYVFSIHILYCNDSNCKHCSSYYPKESHWFQTIYFTEYMSNFKNSWKKNVFAELF